MSGNWKENQGEHEHLPQLQHTPALFVASTDTDTLALPATINLPPHPLHHKTPSVPFSAHTTSTFQVLGNGGSNGNGNINGRRITPSPSYVALQAGSKRLSKLTSSSGSSSIYSSDSSRHDRWHVTEKPDISTVFEEDSLDVDVDEPDQDQVIPKAHRPHNPLQSYPSVSTLTSRTTRTRQERSGTLSSSHSTRSTKSVHPFANAVVRPASPPLPQSRSDNFLSDHTRSATGELPVSRSSPNLENFRMPAQVAVISAAEKDDEETCPVCVESLSFTFRLPGEKPHIVPECGHALHEECFVTVYGDVPPEGSRKNLGVCGVCRQPMRIAEGERHRGKGGNKLAMLTGQSGGSGGSDPKLRHAPSSPSARSASSQDPSADDPLELHGGHSDPAKVCVPSITIRSEFPSIARSNRKGKQVMTAMVTVEVPPAGDRPKYPARARPEGRSGNISPQLPPSPRSLSPSGASRTPVTPDSFAHVVADLKHRVVDYKTSGLDSLGALRLFDLLCVRKGPLVREFHVYLFQEALICIAEEKKSGFRQIFSSGSSVRSQESNGTAGTGRGVLKLKGRIYVKHVRKVLDTSVQGELSLTITMEDESMDSFILTFKDKPSHETWKNNLQRLIEETKTTSGSASKIAKLMGAGAPINTKQPLSPSTVSSGASGYGQSYVATPSTGLGTMFSPASPLPQTPGDLAFAQPLALVHTPLDLVVVLSLPTPAQSQLPLKVKLMRQSLAFVLAALGPRDRISLVACEMGSSGTVRKTPFLCSTRYDSRKRLESFVETLGTGKVEDDEFEVTVGREERQDVVTAVNVALDVVLSRKAKNPLTGIILISDTADVIKRAQMELVTARLEAAHTPVHALGYGKTHDPSPLWMMSNHTHGTYTFVKEWYHLRDALAGVLGGLMSIALTNMKLHLSCQENDFKVTKVSGASQAIVSVTGKDVDVELRELRHGEVREILVELDLETTERYSNDGSDESGGSLRKSPNIHGLGLDTLSVSDASALRDVVYEEALIDEVPVTEVDCSFHDPAAGRSVARLAHPVLLTVAILPSNSPPSSSPADPTIVRRRMELLASDMVTRSLLIASRKNFGHATRILKETKRIIETIAEGLRATQSGVARSKREVQTAYAVEGLQAIVGDVDTLIDGLEEHKELFERDHRNYGAQQAIVLRAQKSWTTRTQTEKLYCTKEVQGVVQLSGEWSPRM
ncbi:hypothetical protein EHS25_000324 [Saitozyma podzolica]|uniref:RING-type domain-containing protein n=1 Tax=Saitozyma podzolica TaxID=1890683 RepID=A0A427YVS2_9TREE|nr:hypothetical protein EHS25_000324 [Saitozyma podzolica]